MVFLLSMGLATLPLLGIAYMFWANPALTVDNIFLSIMLLTVSGIFGLDVLLALRENGWRPPLRGGSRKVPALATLAAGITGGGTFMDAGVVDSIGYFEASVGQPNRFVLTLRNNGTPARMLVFNGDLRDQFPVGQRVTITYRREPEANTLLERRYV